MKQSAGILPPATCHRASARPLRDSVAAARAPRLLQPKSSKSRSILSTWGNLFSFTFHESHIVSGTKNSLEKDAARVAHNRSGKIPICHVVSSETAAHWAAEIQRRNEEGYHNDDNRVLNPTTGNQQFLTEEAYDVIEFKYDKKGRYKGATYKTVQIYYDVQFDQQNRQLVVHHWDGIE